MQLPVHIMYGATARKSKWLASSVHVLLLYGVSRQAGRQADTHIYKQIHFTRDEFFLYWGGDGEKKEENLNGVSNYFK